MSRVIDKDEATLKFSPHFISYDSEFVREQHYFPKLALMQLHQPNGAVELLDPLAQTHALPWFELHNHSAPIVFHSGAQDLELMLLYSGALPRSIRDTQIGFSLAYPQYAVSYATMIAHYLNITLNKGQTRSNWFARPLSAAQKMYASEDVSYLSQAYLYLCAELAQLGRLSWWQEENERLMAEVMQDKAPYRWHRLSGAPTLKGIETAIADLLVNSRETLAIQYDLPRRKIASDSLLIKIAKQRPPDITALMEYLPEKSKLWEILPTISRDLRTITQLNSYPVMPRPPRLQGTKRKLYDALLKHTHHSATQLNIAPDRLISGKQLRQFCAEPEQDCLIKHGWRQPIYQKLLKRLL